MKSIWSILFLSLSLFFNTFIAEANNPLQGDGKIRLFNYHLQEFLELEFRKDGQLVPGAIEKVGYLLRSRDSGQIQPIDPRLLDILDHLQDHFQVDTIEIISGFRSPEFNQKLLAGGHKVNPQSLHMKGIATDIHLDEIREATLVDYLRPFKTGGVGKYDGIDFVHVDLGPVRYWEEKSSGRKLVGVLNPKAPVQLTSDKNEYLNSESINFTWAIQPSVKKEEIKGLKLEIFDRGNWKTCSTQFSNLSPEKIKNLTAHSISCLLDSRTRNFGKYRWVFQITGDSTPMSSNEFYIKKE